MLKKTMAALALLAAMACGSDGPTESTPPPPVNYPSLGGLFTGSQMWLTQFNRTRDGYNGSYTCPGNLTITHETNSPTFSGFAVVAAPCPPVSFDLSGTVDAAGGVRVTTRGPRPGAGTCPQLPVSTYTGTFVRNTLSLRTSANVVCPGDLEGEYTFNIIVTAFKSTF